MSKISNNKKLPKPSSFSQLQNGGVQRAIEQQNAIKLTVTPAIESLNQAYKFSIDSVVGSLYKFSGTISSALVPNIDLYKVSLLSATKKLSTVLRSNYDIQPLASAMASIAQQCSVVVSESVLKLIQSIDYAPLEAFTSALSALGYSIDYYHYKTSLCSVMYNAEWLPYLDYTTEYKLFTSLNEIIKTSYCGSQRQINRIDKTIIDYYNKAKLNQMKKSWSNIVTEKHYIKMLAQAIDAYWRKEYILTICCLATLWETFLFKYQEKERHCGKVIISKFKELSDESDDNNVTSFLFDFFEKLIMGQCNSIEDVKNDLPNRHGVAHGWWKAYPSKKSALNAILLTDFVLKL